MRIDVSYYCIEVVLSRALTSTHACLHNVYDIVAKFLALVNDVHVHCANGVVVNMVVDIVDVLTAKLVAIVIDFILKVKGKIRIIVLLLA